MGYQLFTAVGNVGKDAELRYTSEGIAVASFSLAINKKIGEIERVTWVKVTMWRRMAEVFQPLVKKGDTVFVTGEISVSAYKGQDGEPAASLELTARDIQLSGGRKRQDDNEDSDEGGSFGHERYQPPTPGGDIPF